MPYEFDRYINGRLMAEGVTIERQTNLTDAMRDAAKIASRGPNREIPVLVLRPEAAERQTGARVNVDVLRLLLSHFERLEGLPSGEHPHYPSGVRPWGVGDVRHIASELRRILSALSEPSGEAHPDDLAVNRFAASMRAKLARKRAEGRGGWDNREECSAEHLSYLLIQHCLKGDPLDVGNLAMMLHQRGDRIVIDDETASIMRRPEPAGEAEPDFAASIAEVIKEESLNEAACGWRPCTGCHETNEGYESGRYSYSTMFGCHVGHGCSECGGLGVVWDYWSKDALDDMARDVTTPPDASAIRGADKMANTALMQIIALARGARPAGYAEALDKIANAALAGAKP